MDHAMPLLNNVISQQKCFVMYNSSNGCEADFSLNCGVGQWILLDIGFHKVISWTLNIYCHLLNYQLWIEKMGQLSSPKFSSPQHYLNLPVPIYTPWAKRCTGRVKCISVEHRKMTLARVLIQTAWTVTEPDLERYLIGFLRLRVRVRVRVRLSL